MLLVCERMLWYYPSKQHHVKRAGTFTFVATVYLFIYLFVKDDSDVGKIFTIDGSRPRSWYSLSFLLLSSSVMPSRPSTMFSSAHTIYTNVAVRG